MDLLHSPTLLRAIYRGLQTCGSVWACPVCAARISEHRRKELSQAVANWRAGGGRVVLVTYTIRHKASDDLAASVDGLLAARRLLRSGAGSRRLMERHGITGSVRALEVTHGDNGWHPHVHELLFIAAATDLGRLEGDLRARWDGVLATAGMRDVNEHGIDVRDSDEAVADYVAKFGREPGWTDEHEVAKAVSKRGRAGSRSPMGLLEDYCLGDTAAGRLFTQYARVFKARRQLVWSFGLRALLLPDVEETADEDVVGDASDYPDLLATFSLEQWRVIVGNDARAEVLEVAASGDAAEVWDFVRGLTPPPTLRRRAVCLGQGDEVDYRSYLPAGVLAGLLGPSYDPLE